MGTLVFIMFSFSQQLLSVVLLVFLLSHTVPHFTNNNIC